MRAWSSFFRWADWRLRSSRKFMLKHLAGRTAALVVEIEGGDNASWWSDLGLDPAAVLTVVQDRQRGRGYRCGGEDTADALTHVSGACRLNSVVVGERERIPVQEGKAGVVICSEVLEHSQNPRLVLAEAARLLRRDGLLLVTAPNGEMASSYKFPMLGPSNFQKIQEQSGHVSHIRRSEMAQWASELGLELRGHGWFHRRPLGVLWWELFAWLGLKGKRRLRALAHLLWPAIGVADQFLSRGEGLWMGLAFVRR